MKYLLDTNVFIQAYKRYYAFDFCPGFWEWLIMQNAAGKVASIDKVKEEILDKELSAWAKNRDESFFLKSDHLDKAVHLTQKVNKWIQDEGYSFKAADTFRGCADYYLVGYSLAYGYTVVTEEIRKK